MISLHSHSGQFCRHAKGSLEETVQEAVRQGFRTYGLSEHIPRYERAHLYPEEEDMQLRDLEDAFDAYIIEGTHLKSKYAGQIELLIGLETEYIDSAGLDRLQLLLDKHAGSISYLVGSVHHVNSIPIDFDRSTFDKAMASFPESSPEGLARLDQLFCAYFDAQYEVLQRFRPEVIGHFDLCRLYLPEARFSNPAVWSRITRNVESAISYGALFEVNAAAFRKGWKSAYPGPDIVALIKASKGHFTLSDDSHGPSAVGLHYTDAHRYLVEQSIQNLGYLTMEDDRELSGSGGAERNEDGGGRSGGRTATWAPRGSREEGKARNRTRVVFLKEGWQTDQFWAARR